MKDVEYDQNNQTKFYEVIRWCTTHLASLYKQSK